jgi:hypothetical protein
MKPKLDSKNLRWVLMGSLILSFVVFFLILIAGLSRLSAASGHMVNLKVQSETADNQLSNLEQSKKNIEKYSYFKDVARTVIPNDKDQAAAVLEINQMADAAGIQLQSITFPASNLGAGSAAAAAASKTATISQAKPVTGIPGLYSLELTITPDTGTNVPAAKQATFPKMLDFLDQIENNRHTAQITQVNIQPATSGQTIGFTLTINIFIKP